MNLLNINLIRKKSQQFYKIIPDFYQSAPCMIVRRVLVLIQVRLATLAARQAHVFFNPPVESTRCISAHQIQRRGSLPLSRLANLPRCLLSITLRHLLYGLLAYCSYDTAFVYTFKVVEKKQLLFFLPYFHNNVLGKNI